MALVLPLLSIKRIENWPNIADMLFAGEDVDEICVGGDNPTILANLSWYRKASSQDMCLNIGDPFVTTRYLCFLFLPLRRWDLPHEVDQLRWLPGLPSEGVDAEGACWLLSTIPSLRSVLRTL